jgi:hypothetical protein
MLRELDSQEAREKAADIDTVAVDTDRTTRLAGDVTALDAFKGPLDTQIALTATEKESWDTLKATLATKQEELDTAQAAWDNRDQTEGVDNSGLETAKNDAETARNAS